MRQVSNNIVNPEDRILMLLNFLPQPFNIYCDKNFSQDVAVLEHLGLNSEKAAAVEKMKMVCREVVQQMQCRFPEFESQIISLTLRPKILLNIKSLEIFIYTIMYK